MNINPDPLFLNDPVENINDSTHDKIQKTLTQELIFGICSTIGSVKEPVIKCLIHILKSEYNYEVEIINIYSDFIEKLTEAEYLEKSGKTNEYSLLAHKIESGNLLREKYGSDFLANLAIFKIRSNRKEKYPDKTPELQVRRKCYIIDSLKNKEELKLFRSVYREMFYMYSIFSPSHIKKENLRKQGLSDNEINLISNIDQYEEKNYGQNVRNIFIEADFFVRTSKIPEPETKLDQELLYKLKRYLHLIFESKIITPSKNETAMYHAKSASGNSACLSRQVGASITDKSGNILAVGWNDVPKYGGNLYSQDDEIDHRCTKLTPSLCFNDLTKDNLTQEIIDLIKEDEFSDKIISKIGSVDFQNLLDRIKFTVRNFSKVNDLIEFSRSVHAEMHALIVGSQMTGSNMRGGKLFSTTYPCHNCARHIIAAGIEEVYFIEPYVKSLTVTLHNDAITEDEEDVDKVKILIFDGVAPRRYLQLFSILNKRKTSSGIEDSRDLDKVNPKNPHTLSSLHLLEDQAIHFLNKQTDIKEIINKLYIN